MTPRVSVLVPSRNSGRTLRRAVTSMLEQTVRDLEVIVLNDGSTDDTASVAESIEDPRVRVVHRPPTGIPGTLNAGLELARAPIVAIQDSDDWSVPDRLERQLAVLDAEPDVAVVSGRMQEVGADDRPVPPRARFEPGDQNRLLMRFNGVFHPFVAYRREVARDVGGYDTRYPYGSDYDLWLRIAERHRIVALAAVLGFHVMAGTGVSMRHERAQIGYSIVMRLRAARRRRELRELAWLAAPALSWATPLPLKRALRRRAGLPS